MTKGLDSEEDDESGFFVILKERIATEESHSLVIPKEILRPAKGGTQDDERTLIPKGILRPAKGPPEAGKRVNGQAG